MKEKEYTKILNNFYRCNICKEIFARFPNIRMHIEKAHENKIIKEIERKFFKLK